MQSVYKEYAVPMRNSTLGAWLEALVITLVAMLLGYFYSPTDPLLVTADFPWMLFAPLLIAVRYGFLPGLFSVVLICAALFISSYLQQHSMPISFMVGTLLATFVAGEFRDIWHKKLMALYMANEYRQYRLDDFTRSYRLLQVSHDELELRVAGSNHSLRSTLLLLRRSLQDVDSEQHNTLTAIAEHSMNIFAQYGAFTAAALYSVDQQGVVLLEPLTTLGDMPVLSMEDVLFAACLKTRNTVSIRDELLSKGANPSQLKVCVPLLDADSNLVGILAIAQIPFFSMTEQVLSLLTLLAGYIADILHSDRTALQLSHAHAQYFSQQLQRAAINTKNYNLSSALCVFEMTENNAALRQLLEQSQRGLDLQLELVNLRGHHVLVVLLPLTTAAGLLSYLQRISTLIEQQYPGSDLAKMDVIVHKLQLDEVNQTDMQHFIYQECGLNEQQLCV